MALQLGALRDALIDAGASAPKADKAAEELAQYEARFATIDSHLQGIDARRGGIDARISLLVLVMGINAAVTLAVLGSLFGPWSKLSDMSALLATLARAAAPH